MAQIIRVVEDGVEFFTVCKMSLPMMPSNWLLKDC